MKDPAKIGAWNRGWHIKMIKNLLVHIFELQHFSSGSWEYLKRRVVGTEEIVAFTGLKRNSLKIS